MNTDKIYAEHIANEYSAKKESKVIALKKLDRKAKLPADIFVYTNGIIMSLILGLGMSLSMNVIGNGKFIDYFSENSKEFIDKIKYSSLDDLKLVEKKYLTPYLTFIKDNKKIFRASFNNPKGMSVFDKYNHLKDHILIPILDRFNIAEKERNYLISFYINGIMAIIKDWLNTDCKDSISDVVDVIIKCVGIC